MCLTFAGVPFQDRRVSYDELYSSGVLSFGTYPALEVKQRGVINQTQAMARYAGYVSGFYPSDPWQAAKVDETFAALTDATFCITKTQEIRDMDTKAQIRDEMMRPGGKLHMILSGLESLLVENGRNGIVVGKKVSVADLAAWRFIVWMCSGIVVGVDPELFARSFPELVRLCTGIDALAEVQEWKRRYPEFYATPEARWKSWRPYKPASFLITSHSVPSQTHSKFEH